METQYDDDILYAEIRRQIILLLTSEEDNQDFLIEKKLCNNNRVSVGDATFRSVCYNSASARASHLCSWESNSTPDWLVKLWNNGKGTAIGTGVFIPQAFTATRPGTRYCRKQIYRRVANKS